MVSAAGGNYTQLSISGKKSLSVYDRCLIMTPGGVVAVHVEWTCNLDWDFNKYCLPKCESFFKIRLNWDLQALHEPGLEMGNEFQ